jgi:hypothetical protein
MRMLELLYPLLETLLQLTNRKDRKLWLSQADYVDKTIKNFHLEHATITHVPLPRKWDQQASKNQITAYQQRVG